GLDPLVPLFGLSLLVVLIENRDRLARRARPTAPQPPTAPRPPSRVLAIVPFAALAPVAAVAATYSLATLFFTFLKIGATLYGSGYVLLAFLREDFVQRLGWLTDQQIVDAVAVGQFTPGPVFTTATFIGYLVGGLPGALVATVAVFLPSFAFV